MKNLSIIIMFFFLVQLAGLSVVYGSVMDTNMKGKIAFEGDTNLKLNVIGLDNSETWADPISLNFTQKHIMLKNPIWHVDGKRILCIAVEKNNKFIMKLINPEDMSVNDLNAPIVDILPDNFSKSFSYPQISPDGNYLAMNLFENNRGYRIGVYNLTNNKLSICKDIIVGDNKIFWTPDSNNLTIVKFDGRQNIVCLYDVKTQKIQELTQGFQPIINPNNLRIYFVGVDERLYSIGVQGGTPQMIDNAHWRANFPIGFSKDGRYYYYAGPASWFPIVEKFAIYAFDTVKGKKTRISKAYAYVPWGSLFEGN
jgi:Tol biopolymer transport system component